MEQTSEQLQWLSNLAHWIEGGMFGVVAVMALLQVFGYANSKGAQYVWPALVFVAGLFLPVYIVLQRGLDQIGVTWPAVIRESQQREHFLMALLLLATGLAEILRGAKLPRAKWWGLVAPSAFIAIGVVLFVHTEYGTPEAVAESVLKTQVHGSRDCSGGDVQSG